jgi:uncharacterized protein YcbK (DUF882 family)
MARISSSALVLAAALLTPALASADTTHVVARGHTIETIAHRYHVTVKAIVDANHLKDPKHLRPGEVLIIPGAHGRGTGHGAAPAAAAANAPHGAPAHAGDGHGQAATGAGQAANVPAAQADAPGRHDAHDAREAPSRGSAFESTPRQPDVVHATRGNEEFTIRVKDHRGKIPPPALRQFERMMASGPAEHEIDPRLIALVGIVSNHFGGRKIEIVSGYRPYSATQYTTHSNHNRGKALDFRIQGVPNDVLRDFCRTLHNVGVGYYPNSTFVHLDVREAPATWTDYSRPGEPPRYDRQTPAADESSSEVPDVDAPQAASPPAQPPAAPATGSTPAADAAPAAPPGPSSAADR